MDRSIAVSYSGVHRVNVSARGIDLSHMKIENGKSYSAHMLGLMSEVEKNPRITQRGLAVELGIALGLMNNYIKHCVSRGWIRVAMVKPRRISYFLTPEGISEKSKMVAGYLGRAMSFFREAREECEIISSECAKRGWNEVAFIGAGDFADIAALVFSGKNLNYRVLGDAEGVEEFDAVVISCISHPQLTYEQVASRMQPERVFTPRFLHVSRVD